MKRRKKNKDKRFNLNRFICNNFISSIKYIKKIKNFIFFSVLIFLIFVIFGYLFPGLFEKEVTKIIEELIKQTENLNMFELIIFIIYNNAKSAFFGLALGFLLGIFSLGMLMINGYVIGFVANKTIAKEGILTLWRLLPHGIFELPAIMISVSLGLRLGMFLFIYKGKNKKKEFFKWFRDSLKVFVFIIIPLLIIAGIIEGFLIWLLR